MNNISIEEGGIARILGSVKKLKTALQGGGNCLWIPDSSASMTTKNITRNGEYNAADEGYYGYSQVIVNVTSSDYIIGKGPDGEEQIVRVDEEGDIVEDTLAKSIAVVTYPTKMEYQDGESIDLTGIVVHAYDSQGADMGAIPRSQLSFTPSSASYGEGQTSYIISMPLVEAMGSVGVLQYRKYSFWTPVNISMVYDGVWGALTPPEDQSQNPTPKYPIFRQSNQAHEDVIIYLTQYNGGLYAASDPPFTAHVQSIEIDFPNGSKGYGYPIGSTFTKISSNINPFPSDDYDIYLSQFAPRSAVDPTGIGLDEMSEISGKRQAITIRWARTGDGAILETNINIFVSGT